MFIQTNSSEEYTPLTKGEVKGKRSLQKKLFIALIVILSIVFLLILLAGVAGLTAYLVISHKYPYHGDELHWDWSTINVNNISYPTRGFLWGTASAAHQVEGDSTNNQWYVFENSIDPKTGKSPIANGEKSGKTCDFWNLYPQDISRMNDMNLNSFRFSLEWSKIITSPGVVNQDAVTHYHNVIDELLANGIEPIATLFHFTNPIWFEDLGAWKNESNLQYFYDYSKFAFNEYKDKVKYWITINAPNAYALQGYAQGVWPPGDKNDMVAAADVMATLAQAHVELYQMLKPTSNSSHHQIGIVLNMQQFDPANSTNALDRMTAGLVNNVYTGAFLGYFQTGNFLLVNPGVVTKKYSNKLAPSSIDFLGMNYYANAYVKFAVNAQKYEIVDTGRDIMTDINWPIYPEGIYRALQAVTKQLPKLPIIITENGIADSRDKYRELFIKRYIYAISKAMQEGSNVIGYMYFALVDNFQWELGFVRFGLYSVDFTTQKRTLRNGAKAYRDIVKRFNAGDNFDNQYMERNV
jgi:beta-glucosidase